MPFKNSCAIIANHYDPLIRFSPDGFAFHKVAKTSTNYGISEVMLQHISATCMRNVCMKSKLALIGAYTEKQLLFKYGLQFVNNSSKVFLNFCNIQTFQLI